MIEISKEEVFRTLSDGQTHRKQFSSHSGVQKGKASPTFSVPFDNGLVGHFLEGTGRPLKYNPSYNQHYCFLRSQADIDDVEAWEKRQGTRVFVRNCLSSTVALDYNFEDNLNGKKTLVGEHEELAKHHQDANSIAYLAEKAAETINSISYLSSADYLCAIPAMAEKQFDLPAKLSVAISQLVGKYDITPHFQVKNKRKSLKDCSLDEKWDAWEEASVVLSDFDLSGRSVILIDDKYQSGITVQFFGRVLQAYGCNSAHGLCMVKTLRDTDNVPVVE
ncbi:hypothetical protein [Frigidibacter sp.]|uniref:hypothetical protein n=1 Tax=Frigidibacter sp. TaxID=2586418 RepID=UPI002733A0DF|nr:hypothetical protein [Frigidibacter sp.]MDP3340751.1 hypothetical protein [Frigidibacter sp.]